MLLISELPSCGGSNTDQFPVSPKRETLQGDNCLVKNPSNRPWSRRKKHRRQDFYWSGDSRLAVIYGSRPSGMSGGATAD
jgi:hypothetical protein